MAMHKGRPVGRPPLPPEQKSKTVDTHINIPIDVIEKIDRLKHAGESRKAFLVRLVREYPENFSPMDNATYGDSTTPRA